MNINAYEVNKSNIKNETNKSSRSKEISRESVPSKSTYNGGQIIKGEVVDIRSNQVSIKLPNSEVVTAKLSEPLILEIGHEASFIIESSDEKGLTVKLLGNESSAMQNSIILKALKAAGLPINDKNSLIVKLLLENNMPIDKQTITKFYQQSFIYKNSNIESLILMSKNNIPVNEVNVKQFENYKNYEHRIIKEVENLSKEFSDFFNNISSKVSNNNELHSLHVQMLDIILSKGTPELINSINGSITNSITTNSINNNYFVSNNTDFSNNNMNTSTSSTINNETANNPLDNFDTMAKNIIDKTINTTSSLPKTENLINNNFGTNTPTSINDSFSNSSISKIETPDSPLVINENQRQELVKTLETFNLSAELKNSILKGNATYRQVANFIENVKVEIQSYDLLVKQPLENMLKSPLIDDLTNTHKELMHYNNEIGSFTTKESRENLIKLLDNLNLPENIKNQIRSGEINSFDFLNLVKESNLDNKIDLKELLNSREYQSILKEELMHQWTLNPKSLVKEHEVDNLYNDMYKQLSKLSEFIKATGNGESSLSNTTNNLKDNIDFIKNLNELYTYIQLPMKLKDKNIHSELYVFTNKKALKKSKEDISILLHLDMDYLGSLDINLNLKGKNIIAKFYTENTETNNLLETNMDRLQEALAKKGFNLNFEVLVREKELDFVADFIEKDSPNSSIKRFTFDIRA